MKKGYYLFPCGYEKTTKEYIGVLKKIEMQCAEFSKYFDITYLPIFEKEPSGIWEKIIKRMPWKSANRDYTKILEKIEKPDFIYLRRNTADKKLVCFLKDIKKMYPHCKIIIEVYTYPYERDEYNRFLGKFSLIKDRIYRNKYKGIVDRIVTYSPDDYIFDIKTIKTMNGIDVSSVEVASYDENKKVLDIIFVGYMQKQHGLERAIKGLHGYNLKKNSKTKRVRLHMVGDGPELEYYKSLTNELSLVNDIVFYGKKYGIELEKTYHNCDIGISALGLYKNGINWSSALKSREYLAKGIPVINGSKTDVFEYHPCSFNFDYPNDDSPLDINAVVEWYDTLVNRYGSVSVLRQEIRNYAIKYVDYSVVMLPVVQYINESKNE